MRTMTTGSWVLSTTLTRMLTLLKQLTGSLSLMLAGCAVTSSKSGTSQLAETRT